MARERCIAVAKLQHSIERVKRVGATILEEDEEVLFPWKILRGYPCMQWADASIRYRLNKTTRCFCQAIKRVGGKILEEDEEVLFPWKIFRGHPCIQWADASIATDWTNYKMFFFKPTDSRCDVENLRRRRDICISPDRVYQQPWYRMELA